MIFVKDELKTLWPFYLEYFIASCLYLIPAFLTLYFYNLGFSFAKIGVLLAISPIASLLFEIPTGAFADLYGRKFSVLFGYFLEGLCMLLLFFARNYYFIAFLFALWGVAMTFSSGSKDSWIVDLIKKKDKGIIVHNFFKKQQMIINFGLIISGVLGAIFVKLFGLGIIWLITAVSYLASIITLLIFAKEKKIRNEKRYSIFKQTKETLSYGYKHHVLFYYLFATFIFAFAIFFVASSLSYTPLLKSFDFPDYAFGYLVSLIAFVTMIAPLFSKKYKVAKKERKFIIFCLSISAIIALFVLLAANWIQVILVILGVELFVNMRSSVSEVYFHRFIPSEMRATMASVKALLISIAAALSFLVRGYLVDIIGPRYTFVIYALLIIPVIILYLKIREKL